MKKHVQFVKLKSLSLINVKFLKTNHLILKKINRFLQRFNHHLNLKKDYTTKLLLFSKNS